MRGNVALFHESDLGNFLSGMETQYKTTKRVVLNCLGNFLSGMETYEFWEECVDEGPLGNFLSGMETGGKVENGQVTEAPWKLP